MRPVTGKKFNADIFVDMVCYRKHGHNEGDDPKFTQPHLYELIDNHPNPREVYVKHLLENGDSTAQDLAKEMEKKFWADLQERLDDIKQNPLPYHYQPPEISWKSLRKATQQDFEQSRLLLSVLKISKQYLMLSCTGLRGLSHFGKSKKFYRINCAYLKQNAKWIGLQVS